MTSYHIGRRQLLQQTMIASASLAVPGVFAAEVEEAIPFADAQQLNPEKPRLPWDQTTAWHTPKEHVFWVAHYGLPAPASDNWKLEFKGLLAKQQALTLADLKRRPRREYMATLECSGNPAAGGMIANARWAGTPLAPILKEYGIQPGGIEVVFFAADAGSEKIRGGEYKQNFARSLAIEDAMRSDVLLAYEMNGEPLTHRHGAPVRVVAPGWYGVAWVKWLNRIEVHDRRFMGRFMGRDYVTIRGEQQGDDVVWRETSVGKMNLKSVVARVTRMANGNLRVTGAAWNDGTPLKSVELRIDEGPWMATKLLPQRTQSPHTWMFWEYEWKGAAKGEHTLVSRVTDQRGRVQPEPDSPFIKMKKTYWEANQQALRKITI